MKLYIREKMISVLDSFDVRDEKGKVQYKVKKKFAPAIGLKMFVYDEKGKELACIKEKNISVKPKFKVMVDGEHVATISKKIVALAPRYEVPELGWKVKGNLLEHNYKIEGGSGEVMKIRKERLKLTDSFVMNFSETDHIPEALAVVVAIDFMMDKDDNE